MNSGQTIFSQLMDFLPPAYQFRLCVKRYQGNYKIKTFSCWEQFLTLAFAQLTYRESLRDIEACLRAQPSKLYHIGIGSLISRNTLAHANAVRDWRIYADFAQVLIRIARDLYRDEPFGLELNQTVYALDATTVDLCLSLFPWAQFRRHKSAVKIHTLLDLRGNIPTVVIVSGGQIHEVNILDQLFWEAGAIYLMDRAYLDRQTLMDDEKRKAAAQAEQRQNAFRDRWRTVTSAPSPDGWASSYVHDDTPPPARPTWLRSNTHADRGVGFVSHDEEARRRRAEDPPGDPGRPVRHASRQPPTPAADFDELSRVEPPDSRG